MNLSVVIPIKDERANIEPLYKQLQQVLPCLHLRYEILFVDDGSKDGSFTALKEIAALDPCVKVIQLWRNFGQTAALRAGIDCSSGSVLVTLDGDLQNDPADIPLLLDKLADGYDAVLGWRAHRQDSLLIRRIPSRVANWLIRKVTRTSFPDLGCTLRAMRRDLAVSLPLYGEMHRFVPVLAQQYGAHLVQIQVRHHPRRAGKSKYTLARAVRVVLDLITITFLHSYLTRPMHVMGLAGLGAMGLGLISLLVTLWMKARLGIFLTGNPLLLLSVMFELVGMQLLSVGLIGEVLTRTYFESQGKACYAIRTILNSEPLENGTLAHRARREATEVSATASPP